MTGLIDGHAITTFERQVLQCAMDAYGQYSDCLNTLQPDEFSTADHARLFALIQAVHNKGQEVDLLSVWAESGEDDGVIPLITSLMDSTATLILTPQRVDAVKRHARRRRIRQRMNEILALPDADPITGLELVLSDEKRSVAPETGYSLDAFIEQMQRPLSETRMETGFRKLDDTTGWLPRGSLSLVGARPSVGKTTFAINILLRQLQRGRKVLFVSLEMDETQIRERIASIMSGVPYQAINQHKATAEQTEKVRAAMLSLDGMRGTLVIRDKINTLEAILADVSRLRPDLTVIDFLQYVAIDPNTTEDAGFGDVIRQCKFAARIYNTHVMMMVQLNRESEKRESKRPIMSDIRQCGGAEIGGDIIMLLHRPGMYDKAISRSKLEVIISKSKYGATGILDFNYDLVTQRILEA